MTQTENLTRRRSRREFLGDLGLFLAGLVSGGAALEAIHYWAEKTELPQGYWESVAIQDNRLIASINAYTNDPNVGIERVDVTIKDAEGHWRTVCRLTIAERTNSYFCDPDISELIDGSNPVQVSFNVVSTTGKVSEAPNGVIEVTPE